jgi:hypothetical protein
MKNEVSWLLEMKMEGDEDVREGDSDGEKFGLGKNWDKYDRKASYQICVIQLIVEY